MKTRFAWLSAATVAIFLPPSLFAESTILWSPHRLSVSFIQGTQKSVAVTFSSTRELSNLDFRVSRRLRTFLSVTPSHLDVIHANTPITLKLTFSLVENGSAKNLKGKLRILTGSSEDDDDDAESDDNDDRVTKALSGVLPIDVTVFQPDASTIPNEIALPSFERVVFESGSGVTYAANEIVLAVVPGTTDSQVQELAVLEGASFLGREAISNTFQLRMRFSSLDEAIEIGQRLKNYNFVLFAIPAFFSEPQATFPNDPSWNLSNRFARSWAQEAIHLPSAWDLETGNFGTVMAIIDGGFDLSHEDLNPAQESRTPGFDANHGTEVASVAAAIGNNETGLAGATWLSHLILLGSDWGRPEEKFKYFDLNARHNMFVAVAQGARIITYSFARNWSATCAPELTDLKRTQVIADEAQFWNRVVDFAPNTLFVFAAGNDRDSVDAVFPASLANKPNVISVAATDLLNNQASYSNYGSVSIWAPGGDESKVLCGGRGSSSQFILDSSRAGIWAAEPVNNYGYVRGTSYAAPFVSGVAGLMLSGNPDLSASTLKTIILNTAADVGKIDASGRPIKLLNAFHAVQQALNPPSPSAMDDNFNDNSLNTALWFSTIVPAAVGTTTETNQQLEMARTSPAPSSYQGLASKCSVSGDFDVQVDYRLLNWPAENFLYGPTRRAELTSRRYRTRRRL